MKELDLASWDNQTKLRAVSLNDGIRGPAIVSDAQLSHCLFRDKYLRDAAFKGGVIRHCRFEFCNLRNASLERVDLTGSAFLNCDLSRTSFNSCTLWYVTFDRCLLNYDSIILSAPPQTNIRHQLLRSLRVNASSMGDKAWADRLLHLELVAEREELRNISLRRPGYYRDKYDTSDQARAALRFVVHFTNELFWGHGFSLKRLFGSGLAITVLFAALCWLSPAQYTIAREPDIRQLTFAEALYYSAISLTTGGFGDIMPGNPLARGIAASEGLVGIVFLGFFAAALYRKYSR
jgi:hypothetical protein